MKLNVWNMTHTKSQLIPTMRLNVRKCTKLNPEFRFWHLHKSQALILIWFLKNRVKIYKNPTPNQDWDCNCNYFIQCKKSQGLILTWNLTKSPSCKRNPNIENNSQDCYKKTRHCIKVKVKMVRLARLELAINSLEDCGFIH